MVIAKKRSIKQANEYPTTKRHKASNTFRFQSFNDLIENIDVYIFNKPRHSNEDFENKYNECVFRLSRDRLIPELVEKLLKDVSKEALGKGKKEIINLITSHLQTCDSEDLKPALDLIVALAEDLKHDMFECIHPNIFQELIRLLDTKEPYQIESVFKCLAYLFKYLRREIVKNIYAVLLELWPLFSDVKREYIIDFTAKCFAFVARNFRGEKRLIQICFNYVDKHPEVLHGIAKLFFEIIKNVGNSFRNVTEIFLTSLLDEFESPNENLVMICNELMKYITSFVTEKTNDVSPLWTPFVKVSQKFKDLWQHDYCEENALKLTSLLIQMKKLISCKGTISKYKNTNQLMEFMLSLAFDVNISKFEELHKIVLNIVAILFKNSNVEARISGSAENIFEILNNIKHESLVIEFIEDMLSSCSKYEKTLLDIVASRIKSEMSDNMLKLLAHIIWMKTKFVNFSDLENFGTFKQCLMIIRERLLQNFDFNSSEKILLAVIVASNIIKTKYIKGSDEQFVVILDDVIERICNALEHYELVEEKAKLMYSLFVTFQYRVSLIHHGNEETTLPVSKAKQLIELMLKFVDDSSNYLCSLRILHIMPNLNELCDESYQMKLLDYLCSPFRNVRLLALEVLNKMRPCAVFKLLLEIENIDLNIQTERDKIHKLQNMDSDSFKSALTDEIQKIGVLKFLFGYLYLNYERIWKPTQCAILSLLKFEPKLWPVFTKQISDAMRNDLENSALMIHFTISFECEFLKKHFYIVNGVDDRPDFYNYRCLLLDVVSDCPTELPDKYLIPKLFLDFYENEYIDGRKHNTIYCNIKISDDESFNRSKNISNIEDSQRSKNLNKLFKLLLNLLNGIMKKVPEKLATKIYDTYYELLSNGNSDIQQLALNYICKKAFKKKNGDQYEKRLVSLTKESSVKDELLKIRLDISAGDIPTDDIHLLMKIVLKIMYGKVKKKDETNLRKSMFEFLSDCDEMYVILFFDMFFSELTNCTQASAIPTTFLMNEIDLENALSLSIQQRYVAIALDFLKACGKLLTPSCTAYLLKVIFKITANTVVLVQARQEIYVGFHNLLSKVRVACFEAITYFFDNFEYAWSEMEMQTVVQLFIEPWIEKMAGECLQSPNHVMKLFIVFTQYPRYFPLLAYKCHGLTAIEVILSLLNSKKTCPGIKSRVLEIIERLLSMEERDGIITDSDLSYMDNSTRQLENSKLDYGTRLLLPYISIILQYLEKSLEKRRGTKFGEMYMQILQRVSGLGLDETDSVTLLNLLMPVLKSRANANEEIVTPLLDTVFNLFRAIRTTTLHEPYLLQLAELFYLMKAPPVRKTICELLKHVCEKTGDEYVNGSFIQKLNALQRRWVDQYDYETILNTLSEIDKAADNDQLNFYTGIFVIYNCFHLMKNVDDLSLRDRGSICLQKICPVLIGKFLDSKKEKNVLLKEVLLPLIRDGIDSGNKNFKEECIRMLGHMARKCEVAHPIFGDLHILTDAKQSNNDFFENIVSIQNNGKIQAVKIFNEKMASLAIAPQSHSLSLLFPLLSACLMNEKTAKEESKHRTLLIEEGVKAVEILCRLSTWHHYHKIFKFYVTELRKKPELRKQAIRIISVILDGFHFDLRNATDLNASENPPLENQKSDLAIHKIHVLGKSDADRVYRSIKTFLIPNLNRIFMTYNDAEQYHKLSKKSSRMDQEDLAVMSVPIAFASVKLLKRMPKSMLDAYISSLFLKLCTYLKSKLMSIRLVARETMLNILIEIGPSYFLCLLSEMTSILTRGFQMHVLVFTSHALLNKLEPYFKEGQVDELLDPILEICIADVFGKLAEEKEVIEIASKLPEARGDKSYNMLKILSSHINRNRILDIVKPFREILCEHVSSVIVGKVKKCLHFIVSGFINNKYLSVDDILDNAFGITHDLIEKFVTERDNYLVRIKPVIERTDSLLIPEEPRHLTSLKRKSCARTNSHVLIEFGVELLVSLLDRGVAEDFNHKLMPFIDCLCECLHAEHIKLSIDTLKSLKHLLRRKLPGLQAQMDHISKSVFTILGQYSSITVSGNHADLLLAAIRVAIVLMRELNHRMNADQQKILLFVSEDLQNNNSYYKMGFKILRTLLESKCNISELHKLIVKTEELSITSYNDKVRHEARESVFYYLTTYSHKKKIIKHVDFYLAQLNYNDISGKLSTLEMLTHLVRKFDTDDAIIVGMVPNIYYQLAKYLAVDYPPECKEAIYRCLFDIFKKFVGTNVEKLLYKTTMGWIKSHEVEARCLGIKVLGIYVRAKISKFKFENSDLDSKMVEGKKKTESELMKLVPIMIEQFHWKPNVLGKHVLLPTVNEHTEKKLDCVTFQVLCFFSKFIEECSSVLHREDCVEHVKIIADNCHWLLGHPHDWIRKQAAGILRQIFGGMDALKIAQAINNGSTADGKGFLQDSEARSQLKQLCLDLCDQLSPEIEIKKAFLTEIMKNLLFLAQILQHFPCTNKKQLSLPWLINRLVKIVHFEVAKTPLNYQIRHDIFTLLMVISVTIDPSNIEPLLPIVLLPLMRELTTIDEHGLDIRNHAQTVLKCYREKAPSEAFEKELIHARKLLDIKRAKRRIAEKQLVIANPEHAARVKQRNKEKKKEQKKRKLEKLRNRKIKSRKVKQVDLLM